MNTKLHELNKIYGAMLNSANMYIDEETDKICFKMPKGERVKIKDKFLIAPTTASMKNYDNERHVIFHPLREDTIQGKNDTLAYYQKVLLLKMNMNISVVAHALLNTAMITSGTSGNLNPEQIGFFQWIGNVDSKCVSNFVALTTKEDPSSLGRFFYTVYLKKNGKYKGTSMTCVGIADFPFYRTLCSGKVEGVRNNDVIVYKKLFEYMFPGIEEIVEPTCEIFNHGVMGECYSVNALMQTTSKVGTRVNELLDVFGAAFNANGLMNDDEIDNSRFGLYLPEGYTDYGELGVISRSVPIQRNAALDEEAPAPKPAPVPAAPARAPAPAAPPITPVPAPVVHPMYQQAAIQQQYQQPGPPATAPKSLSITSIVGPEATYQQQMGAAMGMAPGYPPGYPMPMYPQPPRNIHQVPLMPQQRPGYPMPGMPAGYPMPPGYPQPMAPGYPMHPPQYAPQQQMVDPYGRPVNQYGQVLAPQGTPQQPMVDNLGRPVDAYGRLLG